MKNENNCQRRFEIANGSSRSWLARAGLDFYASMNNPTMVYQMHVLLIMNTLRLLGLVGWLVSTHEPLFLY